MNHAPAGAGPASPSPSPIAVGSAPRPAQPGRGTQSVLARILPLLLVCLSTAWFLGCGGDSGPGSLVTLPDTLLINLRDGCWQVSVDSTETGPDCRTVGATLDTLFRSQFFFFTDTSEAGHFCGGGADEDRGWVEIPALGLTCRADSTDGQLCFECVQDRRIDPCVIHTSLSGTATYTDTTYTLVVVRTSSVGGDPICAEAWPSFASACTLTVVEEGTWIRDPGDSTCAPDTTESSPLRRWLGTP